MHPFHFPFLVLYCVNAKMKDAIETACSVFRDRAVVNGRESGKGENGRRVNEYVNLQRCWILFWGVRVMD